VKLIERIAELDRLYLLREQLFGVYVQTPVDSAAECRAWRAVQKAGSDYHCLAAIPASTCEDWHLVNRG